MDQDRDSSTGHRGYKFVMNKDSAQGRMSQVVIASGTAMAGLSGVEYHSGKAGGGHLSLRHNTEEPNLVEKCPKTFV